eukprot:TRINITY_DN2127_c0_g1_i17.p1 TRINITY_DN2127_c0_g1~~TRINITY_DN2127_c0_g1_i17.p1  ORF type:complete len:533 (+),score=119.46 TRINITY_DN2127_c0_g1_i17:72-1670(+)
MCIRDRRRVHGEIQTKMEIDSNVLDFLTGSAQSLLEKADYLSKLPNPEETPFKTKYEARDILKNLLKDQVFEKLPNDNRVIALNAIIHRKIGANLYDTEEFTESLTHIKKALELFGKIPDEYIFNYTADILSCYNHLGILNTNRDDVENGICYFGKALELYDQTIDLIKTHNYEVPPECKNSSLKLAKANGQGQAFNFYYQGRLSRKRLESLHTHTYFYLAQAYAKIGKKEKAAHYCGLTMKRQFEVNTYQVKDFCLNCINLAEFYQNRESFAQAEYLLNIGFSLLPADLTKRKKLRASFYSAYGVLYLKLLETACTNYHTGRLSNEAYMVSADRMANDCEIRFESSKVEFPVKKLPRDNIEDYKTIFRICNTQFKKSLQTFVLDGYVTEHISIIRSLSKAFRLVGDLETDTDRSLAILEKRKEMLLPIMMEINPKAFEVQYQQLLTEVAAITNDQFDKDFEKLFLRNTGSDKVKMSAIKEMNRYGDDTVKYHEEIIKMLDKYEKERKPEELDQDYYQSVVNAHFNLSLIHI